MHDHSEPIYANQLWHARKIVADQGIEELRRHALIGFTCHCGDCFCCAAAEVYREYKAEGMGFGTAQQITHTTVGILAEKAVNSGDNFRQWFYPNLPKDYNINPDAWKLAERGMTQGKSAAIIADEIYRQFA